MKNHSDIMHLNLNDQVQLQQYPFAGDVNEYKPKCESMHLQDALEWSERQAGLIIDEEYAEQALFQGRRRRNQISARRSRLRKKFLEEALIEKCEKLYEEIKQLRFRLMDRDDLPETHFFVRTNYEKFMADLRSEFAKFQAKGKGSSSSSADSKAPQPTTEPKNAEPPSVQTIVVKERDDMETKEEEQVSDIQRKKRKSSTNSPVRDVKQEPADHQGGATSNQLNQVTCAQLPGLLLPQDRYHLPFPLPESYLLAMGNFPRFKVENKEGANNSSATGSSDIAQPNVTHLHQHVQLFNNHQMQGVNPMGYNFPFGISAQLQSHQHVHHPNFGHIQCRRPDVNKNAAAFVSVNPAHHDATITAVPASSASGQVPSPLFYPAPSPFAYPNLLLQNTATLPYHQQPAGQHRMLQLPSQLQSHYQQQTTHPHQEQHQHQHRRNQNKERQA